MGEHLVKAMLFGSVEGIDPSTLFLYQRVGLFHLFSASGYHMAAALLLSEVAGKLLSYTKASAQQKIILTSLLSFSLMTFFGQATDWSSPMVRAYAMATLLILAKLYGLNPNKAHLFALALLVSAFFGNSGPLSFLLSGLAMAGLLLFSGKGWLAMALAPWLFTLPVVLWNFSLLNPFAFIWNFLAFFVGIFILPLSIFALLLEGLGDFYFIPGVLMNYFHHLLVYLSPLDQSFWIRRESILIAVALAFFSKNWRMIFISILICLLAKSFLTPSVALLNVGQGDSIFLRTTNQDRWLVDVGPRGSWASNSLEIIGIGSLDHILLTHLDLDHRGGIDHILSRHRVKKLWLREEHIESIKALEILDSAERAEVPLHLAGAIDSAMKCWIPPTTRNSNESSVVCQASLANGKNICLMGDAGLSTENWILHSIASWKSCHYLKVKHHNNQSSTGEKFLSFSRPRVALISCGKKNRYGHPHQDVIERLKKNKLKILRTDISGTLTDFGWTRFVDWKNQIQAHPL